MPLEESPVAENPYAAPQAPLQRVHTNGEPWQETRARKHYFTIAFRITVLLSIIATLWMGIGLLIAGNEHGEWKQFFAIGFLAVYVFMMCLVVMMFLCSLVVGLDLILQHLGLRTPPPLPASADLFQRTEPDALFFTELANQDLRVPTEKKES
jgi:hypothetical protein